MKLLDDRKIMNLISAVIVAMVILPASLLRAQPNVVVFLTDDFGWRDLACYGSQFYETPEIDQLATEGMLFTQAYMAHPRCVPSRYAMQTGKFPARTGNSNGSQMDLSEETIAETLKQAGYTTFFAGKWHLGIQGKYPSDQGYDINIAGCEAGATGSHFAPYGVDFPGITDPPDGEYLTDRLTDEAVQFIQDHNDVPFFVFLSHYAVHTPVDGKPSYTQYYQAKADANPQSGLDEIQEGPGQTKLKQDHAEYAAMIQSVDDSLGRINSTLKQLNLDDNTLLFFTSDHGGLSNRGHRSRTLVTSNYPLRAGKGWCYEGGIRVPLIVKYPAEIQAASQSDAVVGATDFYPTILDLLDLPSKPTQHLDGVSFADALKGQQYTRTEPLFWHSPFARPYSTGDLNCTVVRDGRYKLIEWYDWKKVELYDLEKDFSETHDLSQQMPDKTAELLTKIQDWRNQVNAFVHLDPRDWWTTQLLNRGDSITPEVIQLFDKYIKSE